MAGGTRSRRETVPRDSTDLEPPGKKPPKRKIDDVQDKLHASEENGAEGRDVKSSKSRMMAKDTERRQRSSASEDPRPAATKLDPHQTRKHAGPVRGTGSQSSTTNKTAEGASKAGLAAADGGEQARKPVVAEKSSSHKRVGNPSGQTAVRKGVAAPMAPAPKPNPFMALLAEVDASAEASKAKNAAKATSSRHESLGARPEGKEQGFGGDDKQTGAFAKGGHDHLTDGLQQGDKPLPRGRSASHTSLAPSGQVAPPVNKAEREVHLSNYDDVCDLVKLLQKERHIIDIKANGGSANRPKNIRFDRLKGTVNWELRVLREHQSILKSLPAEDAIDPYGYPKAFLRYKTGSSFPFQTPLEIGPLYTRNRLSHATKADIKSTFRADTWEGMRACIAWMEEQIEELKTSPLHYNPSARKGPRESMFLEDAKDFKRTLEREKRDMRPPPPPPPMPTPKVDETSAKQIWKTDGTEVTGSRSSKETSLDTVGSSRKTHSQDKSNGDDGESKDVDNAVNDQQGTEDDSDGWATTPGRYSPETSGSGPRTSSPSPSPSPPPSPVDPEQEREYTPYSPLSPAY